MSLGSCVYPGAELVVSSGGRDSDLGSFLGFEFELDRESGLLGGETLLRRGLNFGLECFFLTRFFGGMARLLE